MSEKAKDLIDKYNHHLYIDCDLYKLRSNKQIMVSGELTRVDSIYIKYSYGDAYFVGYAHSDRDYYDHDCLTADEIINADLDEFMDDYHIINFEGLINYLDEKGLL